ncbi:hypothetical protein AX14_002391 [Amanita brunnescens Koide BX004]|nr:hypothetical protein AX14_002391 [Amanita brunnescens Koide BX004]
MIVILISRNLEMPVECTKVYSTSLRVATAPISYLTLRSQLPRDNGFVSLPLCHFEHGMITQFRNILLASPLNIGPGSISTAPSSASSF